MLCEDTQRKKTDPLMYGVEIPPLTTNDLRCIHAVMKNHLPCHLRSSVGRSLVVARGLLLGLEGQGHQIRPIREAGRPVSLFFPWKHPEQQQTHRFIVLCRAQQRCSNRVCVRVCAYVVCFHSLPVGTTSGGCTSRGHTEEGGKGPRTFSSFFSTFLLLLCLPYF